MDDASPCTPPVSLSFQKFRDEEIIEFFANGNRTFQPDNAGENFGRRRLVGAPHVAKQSCSTHLCQGKHNKAQATTYNKTATLPVSLQSSCQSPLGRRVLRGILRDEPEKSVPLPRELLEAAPKILAATITDPAKRQTSVLPDSAFSKPATVLASVMGAAAVGMTPAIRVEDDDHVDRKKTGKGTEHAENRPVLMKLSFPGPKQRPEEGGSASPAERLLAQLRSTDQQLGRLVEMWPRLSPGLKESISALIDVGEQDVSSAE